MHTLIDVKTYCLHRLWPARTRGPVRRYAFPRFLLCLLALQAAAGSPRAYGLEASRHTEQQVSPSTTKELPAFPGGDNYYKSAFAYKITNTMRTRLERPPSPQLIATCLSQYTEASEGLLHSPTVQDAALTTRTWRSHQGTVYQAVELVLEAQAANRAGRTVSYVLSCPLNADDSLDIPGLGTYLSAFKQGMPIK